MNVLETSKGYTSSNLRKHTSANPLQRYLLARFHQSIESLLQQTKATSLLDAGCGEGIALRHVIGQRNMMAVGLDSSLDALQVAYRLNTMRTYIAGNVTQLPFADRSYDLVMCLEVLEHLDDPHQGLRELGRVSRRWLLLSVPNEPFFRGANFMRGKNMRDWGNDPGHVNHWSLRGFIRFVAAHYSVSCWRSSFPWTIVLCQVG